MTADSDSLRFGCPKCQRRLKAPPSLAGSRTRCIYCQSMIDVPRHSTSNDPTDVYPLQTEDSVVVDEQPEYILVVCPVCHARMHPEASQIGRQAICPDCGTSTTISRPPEPPPKKPMRSPEEIGEYALASEVRAEPKAIPAAEQSYVAVVCSRCRTRMLATADQVGSKMTCPDCGTATVVPPMPRPRPKIDVMAGADRDAYAIAGGDDVRPAKSSPARVPVRRVREEPPVRRIREEPPERPQPSDEPELKGPSRHPVLPDQPFLTGTFSFPFYRGVWVRTLILAIWSILPGLAVVGSVSYTAAGLAAKNPVPMFGGAFLMVVTVLVGVLWYAILSATAMAVLRDTSEGCDEIENWPGQVFLDWVGEPLHVFCALGVSAAPGAAVGWLLTKGGISAPLLPPMLVAVSVFLAFPVVLMSTLETNSVFGVLSWPVVRTLFTTADGWLRFYVASGVTVAAVLAVSWATNGLGPLLGLIVIAVLQAPAWLIYFRLLGRLAWVCADRAAFADLERELAEADDEDFDDVEDEDLLA